MKDKKLLAAVVLLACANVLAGIYDGDLLKLVIGADVATAGLLCDFMPGRAND